MQPKRVLIVGGGSAGWIAAAYLNAALNRDGEQRAHITLVESPDVPRIAVGEATIPNIRHILSVIGIDEIEFMRAVDGTFKQSIRYVDWVHNRGDYYHHPFSRFRPTPLDRSGRRWLVSDRSIPFMETVSAQPIICELGLAPRPLPQGSLSTPLNYAFHMNALKFADYLRDFSTQRGVMHHLDHVTRIDTAENGHLRAVETRGGLRLEADLFVDCTGFAGLLIEKTLGVGFVDCSQWLLCNRAIQMHVPYGHYYSGRVKPYTTATALSAGWVWDIPLQDRRSLGYVHSSAYIDEDAAAAELRAFEGEHASELPVRTVHFKVGHRSQPWTGNCVAIGLAGGFIEPLESTGLYLSDLASVMLAEHFPSGDDMSPLAFRFNRIMLSRFYEILDFINMHYCLTQREDTEFWRTVRSPARVNDRLRAKLEFWRTKPPSHADFEDQFFLDQTPTVPFGATDTRPLIDTAALWNHESYEAILYGMDFMAAEYAARAGTARGRPQMLKTVVDLLYEARSKLPPHEIWLQRVLGMPQYATSQK
jgi:tryptophan halogenase